MSQPSNRSIFQDEFSKLFFHFYALRVPKWKIAQNWQSKEPKNIKKTLKNVSVTGFQSWPDVLQHPVGAFNQEKALVGAFSVIVQLNWLIVYAALVLIHITYCTEASPPRKPPFLSCPPGLSLCSPVVGVLEAEEHGRAGGHLHSGHGEPGQK